ncbi:hypothetical protein [Cellulomonas gelida]|uniref:Uncharacterized protein n=1 Tax=Cellulomonas gelida TaxID=1712 RepID=A0A4Y3KIJ6_9CELL|nr:hypothetical protein [Cellulomonas gelida]GEA83733.1 hypothetical protein CGE01nite_09840 [Cellulomonas gelida]GGL31684.1 hypothetical protein GCM10009774_22720 [Cellulomonas gelida]
MTEHHDQPRNPLSDALSAAEHSAAARAYEVPVELVRTRARRRRAGRTTAAAGALALVVAGVAVAVPRLADGDGGLRLAADAPAQCSVSPAQIRAGDGVVGADGGDGGWVVETRVVPGTLQPARQGRWAMAVSTTADMQAADYLGTPLGGSIATSVVLVRDGAVVAVLDGSYDMSLEEARSVAVDMQPQPFPLDVDLAGTFVSCETGEDAVLDAGTYQLVATSTIRFGLAARGSDVPGDLHDARSTSEPLQVVVPAGSSTPLAGPTTCGATDDELRDLADPQTNPAPLLLSASSVPRTAASGKNLSLQLAVTNDGPAHIDARTGYPEVVLVRDGVVVGGPGPIEAIGIDLSLDPGASTPLDAGTLLLSCTDDTTPLEPGDYEVWALSTFTPLGPDGARETDADDWSAAAGPWPLQVTGDAVVDDQMPGLLEMTCGTSADELAQWAAITQESPLAVEATAAPADGALSVTVTNSGDVPVTLLPDHLSAGLSDGEQVVGMGLTAMYDATTTTLQPGESTTFSTTYSDPEGCDGPLSTGTYDTWAALGVTVDGTPSTLVAGPVPVELATP